GDADHGTVERLPDRGRQVTDERTGMSSGRLRDAVFIVLTSGACMCALPRAARAQAWIPSPGEGTVSIQYQNIFSRDHFYPTTPVDIGHIESHAVVFDLSYGLTEKIALDVALPYITSKYEGDQPHPTSLDDGVYHGTTQDFRFAIRYNLRAGRFAVT